jgi:hypothetical protein
VPEKGRSSGLVPEGDRGSAPPVIPAGNGVPGRIRWIPPQHGAWAMLGVPFVAGMLTARSWALVPLAVAWVSGYLAGYFALQAIRTGRLTVRTGRPLGVYGGVTVSATVVLVLFRPEVLIYAPVYLVLWAVTAVYSRNRRDRALASGFSSVAQAGTMVLVVQTVSGAPVAPALGAFLACLLYFAGTVLYVKTVIRERGSAAHLRASIAFHVVAVVLAAVISLWLVPPFLWYLARAVVLPRRRLPARRIGLLEVAGSLALVAALAVT